MSKEWVLRTMNKLIRKISSPTYTTLKRFIESDQYRARLFKLKPTANNKIQITIHKIKNKGLKAFDEIMDTQLPPIDISKPKNNFETRMVKAYNNCRNQKIHKYLGFLTNKEIVGLLQDNYIQKVDIIKTMGQKGIN